MKPAAFDYHAPSHVEEALALLARHGADACVLAGGQSLMPLLALRRVRPAVIVDLNRVSELAYVRRDGDELAIGAMTRQRALERDAIITGAQPLVPAAAETMGHIAIRNRGTVGGNLAHAEPSAELPAVALALDARITLRGRGPRTLGANDFFLGAGVTARAADELVTEVRFPVLPARTGWAIVEMGQRGRDAALAGVVALVAASHAGVCTTARVVIFGACDRPVRAPGAEAALLGQILDDSAARAAASAVAIEPRDDVHAPAAYRRDLTHALVQRALAQAASRAMARPDPARNS